MDVLGKDRLVREPRGKVGRIVGVLVVLSLSVLAAPQAIWWLFSR
jgi:hypothetical protein